MKITGLEKWKDSLVEEKLDNGNIIYFVEKNGGLPVSIGSVIRIDDIKGKKTLWKVSNFHVEDMKVYEIFDNENYKYQVSKLAEDSRQWEAQANFKTEKQAYNWIDFMNGKRYKK